MQCQTVLPGAECTFWSKQGCVFTGNSCQTVVEDCQGCDRIAEGSIGQVCSAAPSPKEKWARGICNMATHRKMDLQSAETKMANPLKASKKASAKKK